jgi:alpha-beta hydrolase superfamily lysophospholipase
MLHTEGAFSNTRHKALQYQAWVPEQIKAVIVLVHGLADHSGRYKNLVDCLVPKGYAIWTYDQMGHGKSPGSRCYVNRFDELGHDLGQFIDLVKQNNPDVPLFLVGHSMGALVCAAFAADHPQSVDGLALSGLVLKSGQSIPRLTLKLAGLLSTLTPWLGVQHLDCSAISRDASVVEAYVKDPLVYTGKIPARMGVELLTAMGAVQSRLKDIILPVLLLHGAADRLAEPSSSQCMYDNVSSNDKELHLFPGCYHEVFNEPCHEFVIGVLSRWLDKHLTLRPAGPS